jgi:hypothetical protein
MEIKESLELYKKIIQEIQQADNYEETLAKYSEMMDEEIEVNIKNLSSLTANIPQPDSLNKKIPVSKKEMQTTTQDKLNEIIPSFDKANNAENQSNLI